jgi:hypothetical protein
MTNILTITELTRVAVVDETGTVRGSDFGACLTYDDAELRHELRGFGAGTLALYQMPEWPEMTDAEVYALPRSVEDLLAHGAVLRRTVTIEADA